MKKIMMFLLALNLVSCASQQAKKEVKQEAATVTPTTSARVQYARALAMIDSNPDLSIEQKQRLVELINTYGEKAYANRARQSQYRTVLMDEMLKNDAKNNAQIIAVKKDMTNLNKENSENLEKFVAGFKAIVGTSARNHQPELLEVIIVE